MRSKWPKCVKPSNINVDFFFPILLPRRLNVLKESKQLVEADDVFCGWFCIGADLKLHMKYSFSLENLNFWLCSVLSVKVLIGVSICCIYTCGKPLEVLLSALCGHSKSKGGIYHACHPGEFKSWEQEAVVSKWTFILHLLYLHYAIITRFFQQTGGRCVWLVPASLPLTAETILPKE